VEEIGLQTSELARLIVALLVLPIIIVAGQKIRASRGAWAYTAMFVAVYLSYLFTIAEEFWFEPLFNGLQHVSLGAAGVFALLAALHTRKTHPRGES